LLKHATAIAEAEAVTAEGRAGPVPRGRIQEIHDDLMRRREERRPQRVDADQVEADTWQNIRRNFPNLTLRQQSDMMQQALPQAMREAQQAARNTPQTRQRAAEAEVRSQMERLMERLPESMRSSLTPAMRDDLIRTEIQRRAPAQPSGQNRPGASTPSADPIQARANQINQAARGQQERAPDAPFQWNEPSTQTEPQRRAVSNLDSLQRSWSAQSIPEPIRRRAEESVGVMRDLLERRGSEAAMSSYERDVYRRHRDLLAQSIPQGRRELDWWGHVERGFGMLSRPRNVLADLQAGRNPNE
jgi:hypothetical protein